MNQNNNHRFSDGERNLFKSVADHIQANPNDYKEAGEWLDEYCSESAYWLRQDSDLEELKKKHTQFPVLAHQTRIKELENRIKVKRTPALIIRFQEARNYLLDKYGDEEFVPKEIAAKVIVITWLLTDPDGDKKKLGITKLETWPWEPIDDVSKMTRGYAGFLFAQNKDAWMSLVRIVQEKIKRSGENESVIKAKPPECLQNILWYIKYGKKYWWLSVIAIFVALIIWGFSKVISIWSEGKVNDEVSMVNKKSGDTLTQDSGQQTLINNEGDGNISVTHRQGVDPKEYGEINKELGKTEQQLKQTKNEKQELEQVVNAYRSEDKEKREILEQAENLEKTKLLVKIFQEQDKGNISEEDGSKLCYLVNRASWEDLKSFLEDKNIKIDEHNQSLVLSGIFKTKITGGGYRARYNPAKIVYVLTPEGNKLHEIATTEED